MPIDSNRGRRAALLCAALAGWFMVAAAVASDDWDWGAVEAEDSAPVTRAPVAGAVVESAADAAERKPPVAEPDFAAAPVEALALFSDLPAFEVIPAKRDEEMHPCSNCHQWVTANPEPRKLKTPHDNFELRHGLHGHGKFWCFTCHRQDKQPGLETLEGQAVGFEHAYVVCSQCHVGQARDWALGLHGKRVGNWQGERQVLNCTACHYQHSPAIAPREALPGPVIRAGLPRPAHWVAGGGGDSHHHGEPPAWERDVEPSSDIVGDIAPGDTSATSETPSNDES
jgi:hypothetical protein